MSPNEPSSQQPPAVRGPDPNPRRPSIKLPPDSCDCHAHVLGPTDRFPYIPERRFTPPDAPIAAYVHMERALGVERGVLLQPSVYGLDNRSMLAAIAQTDFPIFAVAAIDPNSSEAELRRMHEARVRGVRISTQFTAGTPFDRSRDIADRVKQFGWHIDLGTDLGAAPEIADVLTKLPVDVVIDHMGGLKAVAGGFTGAGFKALARLLETGHVWVKLSGANTISNQDFPYADVVSFAQRLVQIAPERLLWGTDWPHLSMKGRMPNDGELCELLAEWVPDEATRRKILADNPARLYGF
jgi:2-pyrone-4,6-dicarboxylate lactonase